jgi:hypothetical protein
MSSDRARAANHENLPFSLRKCFFPVEKHETLKRYRFSKKMCKILWCALFLLLKVIFSDSASKTGYTQVIRSTVDPKLYWWERFESRPIQHVWVDFRNLSSFSTYWVEPNILSYSIHYTTPQHPKYRIFKFPFLGWENSVLLKPKTF